MSFSHVIYSIVSDSTLIPMVKAALQELIEEPSVKVIRDHYAIVVEP
jgi:hypothetical protein